MKRGEVMHTVVEFLVVLDASRLPGETNTFQVDGLVLNLKLEPNHKRIGR